MECYDECMEKEVTILYSTHLSEVQRADASITAERLRLTKVLLAQIEGVEIIAEMNNTAFIVIAKIRDDDVMTRIRSLFEKQGWGDIYHDPEMDPEPEYETEVIA
jgi:hypothetical protein